MNSFVTVYALVLCFCFFCELTKGPDQSLVLLGGTVKLECLVTDKNYPPTWSRQKVESIKIDHISVVSRTNPNDLIKTVPTCDSNTTNAVGENDCGMESDVIELSCKFRVYGNYLPNITWVDDNHPEILLPAGSSTKNSTCKQHAFIRHP